MTFRAPRATTRATLTAENAFYSTGLTGPRIHQCRATVQRSQQHRHVRSRRTSIRGCAARICAAARPATTVSCSWAKNVRVMQAMAVRPRMWFNIAGGGYESDVVRLLRARRAARCPSSRIVSARATVLDRPKPFVFARTDAACRHMPSQGRVRRVQQGAIRARTRRRSYSSQMTCPSCRTVEQSNVCCTCRKATHCRRTNVALPPPDATETTPTTTTTTAPPQ